MTDSIGWLAALILLVTMSRQTWTSWRSKSAKGVSHWLFIGQLSTSVLFTIYAVLKKDQIFVVTNSMMIVNALIGLIVDRRNRKQE